MVTFGDFTAYYKLNSDLYKEWRIFMIHWADPVVKKKSAPDSLDFGFGFGITAMTTIHEILFVGGSILNKNNNYNFQNIQPIFVRYDTDLDQLNWMLN